MKFAEERLSSPFALLRPEPVEGSLSKGKDWKGWSGRSYFDRLSTNGDRWCRQFGKLNINGKKIRLLCSTLSLSKARFSIRSPRLS
jgi:hypothetical protein